LFAGEIVHIEVENAAAVGGKINAATVRAPHRAAVNGAVVHQRLDLVAPAIEYPDVLVSVRLPDADRNLLPVRAEARGFELVIALFGEPVDVLDAGCSFRRQRYRCKPRLA